MSNSISDPLEAMIREAGEGHLIDWFAPRENALPYLHDLLAKADARARARFGLSAPRLTPETLIEAYKHNPHKVRAFLQVIRHLSSDMLVMVWRVLQGAEVTAIEMEYAAAATFNLRLQLSSPDDETVTDEYCSSDINDAAVLHHLGISKLNGQPLFDGFYALKVI